MKRMTGARVATALLGLASVGATSVAAVQEGAPEGEAKNTIVVVNQSVTSVRVYVEDTHGQRYALGDLERGQTEMFEAPAAVLQQGDFRVRVQPRHYSQLFEDPVTIRTKALTIERDETVILWLDRELSNSKVEIRRG